MPRSVGALEELLEIIHSATWWRTTWFELMRLGKRSINMARVFNYREKFTSKDDTLPEVFFHNFKGCPLDGKGAINKADFQRVIKLRYEIIWIGMLIQEFLIAAKLIELGLDWLINEVK